MGQDAPTDPMADVVAEEAAGAVVLEVELPGPDTWVSGDALGEAPQLARWRSSWDRPMEEGREVRETVYPELADHFASQLGVEGVREEANRLGVGLSRVATLPVERLSPDVVRRIEVAREGHQRALRLLETGGDVRGVLVELLRSSDALREVGPEAVARALVAEAEDLFRRIPEDAPYTEKERERITRLVQGSRQALDGEEWTLAIRRAYYAKGLLDPLG